MKKKIALLLALVMMLSLVPATVFADAPVVGPPGSGVGTAVNVPNVPSGSAFTVTLGGPELWGALNAGIPAHVDISLSGAGNAYLGFRLAQAYTPAVGDALPPGAAVPSLHSITWPIVVPNPAVPGAPWTIIATMTVLNNQNAFIELLPPGAPGNPGLPMTVFGTPGLPVPLPYNILVNHADARLTARLAPAGIPLAAGPLANFGAGVTLGYGDTVVFEWDAHLNNFTLTEQRLHALNGVNTVRLLAPLGYSWNFFGTGLQLHPGDFATFDSFTDIQVSFFTQLNGQEELVIRFTANRNTTTPALINRLGVVQIRNLALIPDWDAPLEGDLNVRMQRRAGEYRPVPPNIPATPNVVNPWQGVFSGDLAVKSPAIRDWNNVWGSDGAQTFLVAQRRVPNLTFTAVTDLPDLRSGYALGAGTALSVGTVAGGLRPMVETMSDWYGQAPAAGFTTGRTAVLRIQENVVNALDVARGRPISFEVPEGIIITGFEWRYYSGNDMPDGDWGIPSPAGGVPQGERIPRPPLNQSQAPNVEVIFNSDTMVTLRPNLTYHPDLFAIRHHTLRLEVRLYVSVAPGFANRVLDELVVTASGAGVARLGTDGRGTAVAANIYDPVTIEHNPGPVQVNLVGREQNIYHTDAGSVTIAETAGGMLQAGTRMRVGVVRHYGGVGFPLNISRGHVISDPASNLELLVTRIESPTIGNEAVTWIHVEVTRESQEDHPGEFTIDGLTLFGHVYQGERYYLIVTGGAIAENHWGVLSTASNPMTVGVFAAPPYYVEIIEVVTERGGEAVRSLLGQRFAPNVAIGAVANPFIWRQRLDGGAMAGFISARAFAYAAGIPTENIHWDDAAGVATIIGRTYQDREISVRLTRGATVAEVRVDGVPVQHDIGLFSGSGPQGSMAPVMYQGRMYLPMRFLFNAFGYHYDYDFYIDGIIPNASAVVVAR